MTEGALKLPAARTTTRPFRLRAVVVIAAVSLGASAAEAQSRVDILKLLPQTDPATDYTKTINDAAAAGSTIFLRNTGKPYVVAGPLQFSTRGAGMIGEAGTTIAFTGTQTVFRILAPDITFENIMFDGTARQKMPKPEAYCVAPRFKWTHGGMHFGGPVFLQVGCDGARISGVKFDFDSSTALTVQGTDDAISDSTFTHNMGFGMIAGKGATHFLFRGNHGSENGIEVIAVSHGARDGEIQGNDVVGTGDNCISISGDDVRVIGNTVKSCLGHGIGVYGNNNTISNNTIIDNGQIVNPAAAAIGLWNGTSKAIYHSPGYTVTTYDAIKVVGAFGGKGEHNVVNGNTVSDDQATPTQGGIVVAPTAVGTTLGMNVVGRHRSP